MNKKGRTNVCLYCFIHDFLPLFFLISFEWNIFQWLKTKNFYSIQKTATKRNVNYAPPTKVSISVNFILFGFYATLFYSYAVRTNNVYWLVIEEEKKKCLQLVRAVKSNGYTAYIRDIMSIWFIYAHAHAHAHFIVLTL